MYNLHYLSYKYPDKPTNLQKKQIINLIDIMKKKGIRDGNPIGIPCIICRNHFIQFCNKNNIESVVSSRSNLFYFFLDCHNEINKKTGKKIISYDEAFEYYSNDVMIRRKKIKWEKLLILEIEVKEDNPIGARKNTLFNVRRISKYIYKSYYIK